MRVPFRRMRGFVIGPIAPYGDLIGATVTDVVQHGYLRCYPCGRALCVAATDTGVVVYVCFVCCQDADLRRVA